MKTVGAAVLVAAMTVAVAQADWSSSLDEAHRLFYSGHYAIHGTTAVAQLGSRASKGCVRLHPSNAAVLFALVQQHGSANTRIVIEDSVTRVAQR